MRSRILSAERFRVFAQPADNSYSRYLTPGEKAAELDRFARWRADKSNYRTAHPEARGGEGWIDPEVLPMVDALNAIDGVCTVQSCCGHRHSIPGDPDGADRVHRGQLWVRLGKNLWPRLEASVGQLLAHDVIVQVERLYAYQEMREPHDVLDVLFREGAVDQAHRVIVGFFREIRRYLQHVRASGILTRMAARKRESVARSASSESQMTYSRFLELFPDNDACLEYLRGKFFPDGSECPGCGKATKFFRIKSRAAYSCMYCRHQVYPTAGTIFHKSTVSLQLWFFAIYLMSSTRCGISAKQLEREIGVTYKTAHRMFKQIRTLLSDDGQLSGNVEADETAVGGKPRAGTIKRLAEQEGRDLSSAGGSWRQRKKSTVFGMVERGGRVRAQVVADRSAKTLQGQIAQHVLPGSMIFTDEWPSYLGIDKTHGHRRVKHSAHVYVDGDLHTQTIEGFWSLFKNGVRGVYHAVSTTYLQDYLNEYTFRYNRRDGREPMFWAILARVEQRRLVARPTGS